MMQVNTLSVLVTLWLLSPAAGIQTQRGQETDHTALDPATCIEAVIVEPRKLKSISTALLSAVNAKNAHFDLFTIAHGNLNTDYVGGLVQNDTQLRGLKKQGRLRFLGLPFDDLGADTVVDANHSKQNRQGLQLEYDLQHHDQYSRVLKSKDFWNRFTCDRILLMQSDTTLCSNSQFYLKDFLQYEYIGGHNGKVAGKYYFYNRTHINGGFSFRHRHAMLRCIDALDSPNLTTWKRRLLKHLPEDGFYSNCEGLKQPTKGACRRFAIDGGAYAMQEDVVSFGVHKPWMEFGCNGCKEINMRLCKGAAEIERDMHE